ncbi:hypothetical protein [Streptomyces varsoviensis]|uniref:hypothetical protein n=1 Tax=Streptomyces varsoviensis TaxID=67373 RepID=UPI000A75A12D|nr:hypothetical protein [Streptomyces varsoviensis]
MDDPFRFSEPLLICDQLLSNSVGLPGGRGDLTADTDERAPARPKAEPPASKE